jgi:D-tyrosyl-tRNA(Tyr) deacylase
MFSIPGCGACSSAIAAAADPEIGRKHFGALVEAVRATGVPVATGQFGADMRVELVSDGPVTVILDSDD